MRCTTVRCPCVSVLGFSRGWSQYCSWYIVVILLFVSLQHLSFWAVSYRSTLRYSFLSCFLLVYFDIAALFSFLISFFHTLHIEQSAFVSVTASRHPCAPLISLFHTLAACLCTLHCCRYFFFSPVKLYAHTLVLHFSPFSLPPSPHLPYIFSLHPLCPARARWMRSTWL